MNGSITSLKSLLLEQQNSDVENAAAERAKQLGLKHVGYGNYADRTGTVVAKSKDGILYQLNSKQRAIATMKANRVKK
jgi:hypothetical protein